MVSGKLVLSSCRCSGRFNRNDPPPSLLTVSGAALEKDTFGITPAAAAALTGHTDIVEYLISSKRISAQEKLDSLHLLGATFVDKKRDLLGALNFWRRAIEMKVIVMPLFV